MLRDPHHDLNLLSFRDFVASKPADRRYEWQMRETCACGQFSHHIGLFDEWYESELSDGIWAQLNRLALCDRTPLDDGVIITWGELLKHVDRALAA